MKAEGHSVQQESREEIRRQAECSAQNMGNKVTGPADLIAVRSLRLIRKKSEPQKNSERHAQNTNPLAQGGTFLGNGALLSSDALLLGVFVLPA